MSKPEIDERAETLPGERSDREYEKDGIQPGHHPVFGLAVVVFVEEGLQLQSEAAYRNKRKEYGYTQNNIEMRVYGNDVPD